MTKPDTYAKKSQAEKWLVRSGHEWAFIFVDEDTGTLSIVSSFGNWGYTWAAYGAPERTLKEFLAGLNYDYFFGKVDGHHKGREFDLDKSIKALKELVIDRRKQGSLESTEARWAWQDIESVKADAPSNADHFYALATEKHDLSVAVDHEWSGLAQDSRHPQCEGFWAKLWSVFLEATKPKPPAYLIKKRGAWYRPNSQGYTVILSEAGRYSLEEAIAITHPNGPDGPRDGMSYEPAPVT